MYAVAPFPPAFPWGLEEQLCGIGAEGAKLPRADEGLFDFAPRLTPSPPYAGKVFAIEVDMQMVFVGVGTTEIGYREKEQDVVTKLGKRGLWGLLDPKKRAK